MPRSAEAQREKNNESFPMPNNSTGRGETLARCLRSCRKTVLTNIFFFFNFSDSVKTEMRDSTMVSAGQTYKRQLPLVTHTIKSGHFYLI